MKFRIKTIEQHYFGMRVLHSGSQIKKIKGYCYSLVIRQKKCVMPMMHGIGFVHGQVRLNKQPQICANNSKD